MESSSVRTCEVSGTRTSTTMMIKTYTDKISVMICSGLIVGFESEVIASFYY